MNFFLSVTFGDPRLRSRGALKELLEGLSYHLVTFLLSKTIMILPSLAATSCPRIVQRKSPASYLLSSLLNISPLPSINLTPQSPTYCWPAPPPPSRSAGAASPRWAWAWDWHLDLSATVSNRQYPSATISNHQQPSVTVSNRQQPTTTDSN